MMLTAIKYSYPLSYLASNQDKSKQFINTRLPQNRAGKNIVINANTLEEKAPNSVKLVYRWLKELGVESWLVQTDPRIDKFPNLFQSIQLPIGANNGYSSLNQKLYQDASFSIEGDMHGSLPKTIAVLVLRGLLDIKNEASFKQFTETYKNYHQNIHPFYPAFNSLYHQPGFEGIKQSKNVRYEDFDFSVESKAAQAERLKQLFDLVEEAFAPTEAQKRIYFVGDEINDRDLADPVLLKLFSLVRRTNPNAIQFAYSNHANRMQKFIDPQTGFFVTKEQLNQWISKGGQHPIEVACLGAAGILDLLLSTKQTDFLNTYYTLLKEHFSHYKLLLLFNEPTFQGNAPVIGSHAPYSYETQQKLQGFLTWNAHAPLQKKVDTINQFTAKFIENLFNEHSENSKEQRELVRLIVEERRPGKQPFNSLDQIGARLDQTIKTIVYGHTEGNSSHDVIKGVLTAGLNNGGCKNPLTLHDSNQSSGTHISLIG